MEVLEETSTSTTTLSISSPKKDIQTEGKKQKSHKDKDNFGDVPNIPHNTFCTVHAEKGEHRSNFKLLPYCRALNPKYSGTSDKLAKCIKRGGGFVINDDECRGQCSSNESYEIKILDVEYVRENIWETQDMVLPYDCFSSNFIWNQIYHRSNNTYTDNKDANLNVYRISPSAHVYYDANLIFQGAISWNDIPPIPSDKLASTIRIKEVALQLFPELVVYPERPKTRRLYTRHDSQVLLDAVCNVNGHNRIMAISLYKEIAKNFLPSRSSHSLKEHFHKTVLPHVMANDGYYTITQDDSEKFQKARGQGTGRMKLRSKKENASGRQHVTEDESGDEETRDALEEVYLCS